MPLGICFLIVVCRDLGFTNDIAAVSDLSGFRVTIFIGRTDYRNFLAVFGINRKLCAAEVDTRLSIRFQDLNEAFLQLIGRLDGHNSVIAAAYCYRPLRLAMGCIVLREGSLYNTILTVRNIFRFCIASVVGRTNGSYLTSGRIIYGKDGSTQVVSIFCCFLINLNVAFLQFIDRIDGYNTVIGRIHSNSPL